MKIYLLVMNTKCHCLFLESNFLVDLFLLDSIFLRLFRRCLRSAYRRLTSFCLNTLTDKRRFRARIDLELLKDFLGIVICTSSMVVEPPFLDLLEI